MICKMLIGNYKTGIPMSLNAYKGTDNAGE